MQSKTIDTYCSEVINTDGNAAFKLYANDQLIDAAIDCKMIPDLRKYLQAKIKKHQGEEVIIEPFKRNGKKYIRTTPKFILIDNKMPQDTEEMGQMQLHQNPVEAQTNRALLQSNNPWLQTYVNNLMQTLREVKHELKLKTEFVEDRQKRIDELKEELRAERTKSERKDDEFKNLQAINELKKQSSLKGTIESLDSSKTVNNLLSLFVSKMMPNQGQEAATTQSITTKEEIQAQKLKEEILSLPASDINIFRKLVEAFKNGGPYNFYLLYDKYYGTTKAADFKASANAEPSSNTESLNNESNI